MLDSMLASMWWLWSKAAFTLDEHAGEHADEHARQHADVGGGSIYISPWECSGRFKYNIARFVGGLRGFNPLPWCLSTPKFSLTPTVLVKNSQKYIGDPSALL